MANIKLSYLYRDGANYKTFKDVVFANPDNVDLAWLEKLIRSKLISDTWFYVDEWLLPDLHFLMWDNTIDHTWHEFENVSYTTESDNFPVPLSDWITKIKAVECLY